MYTELQHWQSKSPYNNFEGSHLPVLSPYLTSLTGEYGLGRDKNLTSDPCMLYVYNLSVDQSSDDSTTLYNYFYFSPLGQGNNFSIITPSVIPEVMTMRLRTDMATKLSIVLGTTLNPMEIVFDQPGLGVSPPSSSSYQTIVSQTSTSAPAVSGGFTPVSTYTSGVTFTWARTGAGVYTLTASSAVFNTSGKTGVFVAPLQNLNASIRSVVTSSTVITVTTAVQSVAILGLLGLTATNTDALLNGTMIYVQTYS